MSNLVSEIPMQSHSVMAITINKFVNMHPDNSLLMYRLVSTADLPEPRTARDKSLSCGVV